MNIPPHGHCEICSATVTQGERFCGSAKCAEKHEDAVKEKKRSIYILIAVIVAVLILTKLPLNL